MGVKFRADEPKSKPDSLSTLLVMPISQENLTSIDELSNRLAAESILIQTGRDDGLIPIYSLLGELIELSGDDVEFATPPNEVRSALDILLDAALPFDDAAVALVQRLIDWLPMAILTRRAQDELPSWSNDALEVPPEAVAAPIVPINASTQVVGVAVDTSVDTVLDLNMEENAELLAEFHAEAVDHLQQIEAALLVLDEEPKDADALSSMFRSFHTIKGVSGFLKLTPMHTLTHEVESLLDLARNDELDLTPPIITEILQLRAERAKLLGYETHAHWRLENAMAKTPEATLQLMEAVWTPALARVKEEVADMSTHSIE